MGYAYRVAAEAETVMAEPYASWLGLTGTDDSESAILAPDLAWELFVEDVQAILPPAWQAVTNGPWRRGHPGGQMIAQSGLHELLIEEDRGGYGYAYLSVISRYAHQQNHPVAIQMHPLALERLPITAKAIFDRLGQTYPLRIPQGYTSSPYRVQPQRPTQMDQAA